MHDGIHVVAGECTTTFDGSRVREHEQRGQVIVITKPDKTVDLLEERFLETFQGRS